MTPDQNRRRLALDDRTEQWEAIKADSRKSIEDRIARLAKSRKAGEFFRRELANAPETEAP